MKSTGYILMALMAVSPLCAQRYILKDGKVLKPEEVVLKDGALVKSLGGDAGEQVFPLAQVVRLDWPEPEEIDQASQLLALGNAADAELKITPIYSQFAPFAKVPGGWWNAAALIRARALLARQQRADAEKAAQEILATSSDSETLNAAQLITLSIQIQLGKGRAADAKLDELARQEISGTTMAAIAVLRGDIAYARKDFEKSLEFYLEVPAFHGSELELMPPALLGSARSLRGYGDAARAERAYLDLVASFPTSAEAAIAKRELAAK
jgi:hypothetical protein